MIDLVLRVRRRVMNPLSLGFIPALAGMCAFWLCIRWPLFDPVYSTVVMDREGRLLSASIAADGQWRFPPDGVIPERFEKALLAWEDKRFYAHPGVDPFAMARALVSNLKRQEVVSGASTLTMQVIRLSRPGAPRTVPEKLLEMMMALRLSAGATKGQVLRYFTSHAPFGGNVVGFEAASWRYFGREPETLSWAECALLAVLPNSPGLVHPGKNRELLRAKRDECLARLRAQGAIDQDTYTQALLEPLPPEPYPLPQHAPHLLERFKAEGAAAGVDSRGGAAASSVPAAARAARLRTTLDYSLQVRINQILERSAALWRESGIENGAVLVLDVATGNVLAYAGNVPALLDRNSGGQVDIIQARRSTGSLLKPFLYAAMLDAGEILPDQLVSDVPTRIGGFVPENNTGSYSGAVPASQALARSLNVPAVRLLRSFGVQRFADVLKGLGMTTLIRPASEYGLTLILGGAEGTLWELTGMYAGMARSALRAPAIRESGGSPFFMPGYVQGAATGGKGGSKGGGVTALSPGACWLTLKALLEVERPGEEGSWRDYLGSRKVAWKTGTSQGYRDAWAIGVTPKYAVGVWVGNASGVGKPDLKGSVMAAPVLFDVFALLPETGWFSTPESDLARVSVCAKSGLRAGPDCTAVKDVLAPAASLKADVCRYCRIIHLDSTGKYRASTRTEPMASLRAVPWFVLPPAMEWFYERAHADYRPLPPWKPGSGPEEESSPSMALIFPDQNGRIYVPIDLDGTPEMTVFRAAHRDPRATIFWHLDGEYLGETTEIHDMEARPGLGKHTLTLIDERGDECVRTFWCLSEK